MRIEKQKFDKFFFEVLVKLVNNVPNFTPAGKINRAIADNGPGGGIPGN